VGPFSGVAWPESGVWLEVEGDLALCRNGVHGIHAAALPVWMAEELWRVELEGWDELDRGIVLARRGRLVERVDGWDDQAARAYGRACVERLPANGGPVVRSRAADTAAAAAAATAGPAAASVGYIAAQTAEAHSPGGFDVERRHQAAWLLAHLRLER
jgi:hypothetical protein